MAKIEFEDRTKPRDETRLDIEDLASSFFNGAIRVGIISGFSSKEIIKAFLIAREDLCKYGIEMDCCTEEELQTLKQEAVEVSNKRVQLLKESGTLDTIKRAVGNLKGDKE